jgi:hypothetical protein
VGAPVPGRQGERFTFISPPRGDRSEVAFYASGTARPTAFTAPSVPEYFVDNTAIDHDGRDTSFTARRPIDTGYSLWIDRDGTVTRIATSGEFGNWTYVKGFDFRSRPA